MSGNRNHLVDGRRCKSLGLGDETPADGPPTTSGEVTDGARDATDVLVLGPL